MSKEFESVSEAAAHLAGDPDVKERVEQEISRSQIVKILLNLRAHKGMTQKEIAELMACDPSKISKLESGNDLNLKWGDIVQYLSALGAGVSIMIEDESLPAASRIKQHVFRIRDLLEELADLAKEVGDDTDITDKIHQFYGEVLFNFLARFQDSYEKLDTTVRFCGPSKSSREIVEASEQERVSASTPAIT